MMAVATKTQTKTHIETTKRIKNAKPNQPSKDISRTAAPSPKETFLLRFRESDSLGGISKKTVELLSEVTGLTLTDLLHQSLLAMAAKHLPPYELDSAPLTDAQLGEIRAMSSATNTPDESFDQRLF